MAALKLPTKLLQDFAIKNMHLKIDVGDVKFDFARNFIDDKVLKTFESQIEALNIHARIQSFFECDAEALGYKSVSWHPVFRDCQSDDPSIFKKEAAHYLDDCFDICEKIYNHDITGFDGAPIKHILNIGIGGSDLGVRLGNHALREFSVYDVDVDHLNQPDQFYIDDILSKVNFKETLVIYTSKSFHTLDMLACLDYVRGKFGDALAQQFIAVTSNEQAAMAHGFDASRIVKMPPWIGGRYSLSSPAGFSFILKLGRKNYLEFLSGMREIDLSFQERTLLKNPALLAALIEFHYIKEYGVRAQALQAYDNRLWDCCAYYQQLYMESLGKKITDPDVSSNVIFGGLGIKGQHAYYQALHEGNQLVPIEFIVKTDAQDVINRMLFANAVAQSQAFMRHNRPMNILTYHTMSPKILGQLIAYFEHKVFALAQLMHLNPFDQPGVELGKNILKEILPAFDDDAKMHEMLDDVTQSFFDLSKLE